MEHKEMHAFLLVGQSNMAGRGFMEEAVPFEERNLFVLRNGRWQKLFRPVHPDRSFAGVCLAESFAAQYAQKHGVQVGLIPCADGGTALSLWKEGELLFDHACYQTALAARTATVVGILWHQGEADCAEPLYLTYKERFIQMVKALRRRTGLLDVPFVVGALGDFLADCELSQDLKNYPFINEALQAAVKEMPGMAYVSAQGLTSNPDKLHFNARSLYEFGLRYFEAYEKIAENRPVFSKTPTENIEEQSFMEAL